MAAQGRGVSAAVGLVRHEPSETDIDCQSEAPPFRPKCLPSQPTALEEGVGAVLAAGMLLGALLVPVVVLLALWWAVEALWRLF